MSKSIALIVGLVLGLAVSVSACREPCTAESCAGCCDAMGECRAGNETTACGRRGDTCSTCAGACVRQVCAAAPDAGQTQDSGVFVSDAGCSIGQCGAQVCNVVSGMCEVPGACDAQQPQPAGCGSGHVCTNNVCADVPRPSCTNFSPQSAPLRWNPAINFGPVITGARAVSFGYVDAGCPPGASRRGVAEVTAYDFMSRFADGGLPRLFLYRENMTLTEVQASQVLSVTPSNAGGVGTVELFVCAADATVMLTQGFAFEGGNGACVTFR